LKPSSPKQKLATPVSRPPAQKISRSKTSPEIQVPQPSSEVKEAIAAWFTKPVLPSLGKLIEIRDQEVKQGMSHPPQSVVIQKELLAYLTDNSIDPKLELRPRSWTTGFRRRNLSSQEGIASSGKSVTSDAAALPVTIERDPHNASSSNRTMGSQVAQDFAKKGAMQQQQQQRRRPSSGTEVKSSTTDVFPQAKHSQNLRELSAMLRSSSARLTPSVNNSSQSNFNQHTASTSSSNGRHLVPKMSATRMLSLSKLRTRMSPNQLENLANLAQVSLLTGASDRSVLNTTFASSRSSNRSARSTGSDDDEPSPAL